MAVSHPIIGAISNYQVPIFIFIGLLIFLTVIVEKYSDKLQRENVPGHIDYEKESLKEIFDASVRYSVKKRGKKVKSPFYEGKFKQGYVYKELSEMEADEPIEISVKRTGKDGKETEELEEVRIWLIGNNSSKTSRYKSKIKNGVRSAIGRTDSRDIQVISADLIKTETEDKIVLQNGIDWTYDPDIEAWFSVGTAENNIKKRTVMDKTLNKMLEEFPNYVEKANNVNPSHTMRREIENAKKDRSEDPSV